MVPVAVKLLVDAANQANSRRSRFRPFHST